MLTSLWEVTCLTGHDNCTSRASETIQTGYGLELGINKLGKLPTFRSHLKILIY